MNSSKSLFVTRALTLLAFAVITLCALAYFSISLANMIEQFMALSTSVVFTRGAYYMLGTGISSGALLLMMTIEVYTKKPPSDKMTKVLVRTIIFGLVLAFLLPVIAENLTENYLLKKGYGYCDVPSASWPMYKNINYTLDAKTCSAIIEKDKNKFSFLYS